MLENNLRRFRLACAIPDATDATSLARGYGPLAAMCREDPRLELFPPPRSARDQTEYTWDWLAQCDAVFMQRPSFPAFLKGALLARSMGIPVWIDWDDDLTAVPRSNPTYPVYSKKEVPGIIDGLVEAASVITVSTEELAKRRSCPSTRSSSWSSGNAGKIRVIPNAASWPFSSVPRKSLITWRGTKHHLENVDSVLEAISSVSNDARFRHWRWLFMGDIPWNMHNAVPETALSCREYMNPFAFMEYFSQTGAWVHIVPLTDNGFNRCKSNLAWLEASSAGAVVLAPDWQEWQHPGVINYRDKMDFAEKLRKILEEYPMQPVGLHPKVAESRSHILKHLSLRSVNQLRWKIVNELAQLSRAAYIPLDHPISVSVRAGF